MPKNGKSALKIWLDGKLLDYDKGSVPILTHSLQYGSGIFEGIRAYETSSGAAVFRLQEHVDRFFNSAKIYRMKLPFSKNEIFDAVKSVVRANRLKSCYIRPFAFYNDDNIGLSVKNKKLSVYIAAVPFGAYFGSGEIKGLRCKVSSWHRINSGILPVKAKASGNYINSILASSEANASGFDEAIMISEDGDVAEGAAENIFMVKNKTLITPGEDADILNGITRSTIIELAEESGLTLIERAIKRDELYTADEIFFAGTAAEITPIVNVDGVDIGRGVGQITRSMMKAYDEAVHGKSRQFRKWLTFVD